MSMTSPFTTKVEKGAYSAIVFKDGDYIIAEDSVGTVIKENTNAATSIQAAIDSLTSGKILVKYNTDCYEITSGITIEKDSVILEGEVIGAGTGKEGTCLKATSAFGAPIISIGASSSLAKRSGVRNLNLLANTLVSHALKVYGNNCIVEHIIAWYATNTAIEIAAITGAAENHLNHVIAAHSTYNGILIMAGDIQMTNITTHDNGSSGIQLKDHGGAQISNFHLWEETIGLVIQDSLRNQISNGYIENCVNAGVRLRAKTANIWGTVVSGISFWNNNTNLGGYPHIRLECDGANINGFNITNCYFDAANSIDALNTYLPSGTIQDGLVTACTLDGGTSGSIASAKYRNNIGYITENTVLSSTFAIDSTGVRTVTIAHGLAVTPALKDCNLSVVEVTNVDDWAFDLLKVESVGDTNVGAKIHVSTASATGSATAKLALRVGAL